MNGALSQLLPPPLAVATTGLPGAHPLNPSMARPSVHPVVGKVTPRSLQVFASALRYGKRVSAQRFGISEYGVKFHTRQVYAALGLEPQDGGRLDGGLAIEAAIQLGWLRIPAEFA